MKVELSNGETGYQIIIRHTVYRIREQRILAFISVYRIPNHDFSINLYFLLGIIDGTFGTTGKIKILNMDGFSESIQTRYRKLKKGEKREDHNQDGISIKLKFFKNIHSKDKNSILQF